MVAYGPHGKLADSWWTTTVPTTLNTGTANTIVGMILSFTIPGRVFGLRAYSDPAFDPVQYGVLAALGGPALQLSRFPSISGGSPRWTQSWFHPAYRITVGADYMIGLFFAGGHVSRTNNALTSPITRTGITFTGGFQSTSLGWHITIPTSNTNANAVDVLFQPD